MLITLSLTIIVILYFIAFLCDQPLSLGVTVLLTSFIVTALTRLYISSWFAYILFLVYIRGLLVIFSYLVALAPYKPFKTPPTFFIFVLIILPVPLFTGPLPQTSFLVNNSTQIWLIQTSSNFYSITNLHLTLFLTIILLLALIVVVKIIFFQQGPLRPFN